MASMDYRRIVQHWTDWKLFHLDSYMFQLCWYDSHNQESYQANIAAKDDKAAIKQCGAIIRKFDRKRT